MLGQERAFKIMEDALTRCEADQMELVLLGHDHFLSRYANSQIHQNVAEEDATLYIKAVIGKRIGVSTLNQFHPKTIARAVQLACESARRQREIEDFPGLASGGEYRDVQSYFQRTAEINPEEKALVIRDMIERAHGDRVSLSGAFYTGEDETAIMNTNGVKAYTCGTKSNLAVIASAKDTSGYAAVSSRDVDEIDHVRLVEEALESAKKIGEMKELEPGEYPVILDEYAVSEMLLYLSYISMSTESAEDGESFIPLNKGKQLFGEDISIYDDAYSPETLRTPFDYEGTPKRRVDFIKQGVVTGELTCNNYEAKRLGIKSTGHALPPLSGLSSTIPFNLIMEGGKYSEEELMEKMGTGILVKRFHYLTFVHPLNTLISGMTRDGVFWVENGKIVSSVQNMRFTQSIIEALKNVKGMTKSRKLIWFRENSMTFPFSSVVPRLYIDKFNFTGKTEF